MKKFAVVLQWDTESDIGDSPVLVGVYAKDQKEAMEIALKQAESGELYDFLFGDDGEGGETPSMRINEDASFACPIKRINFIN